MASYVQNAKDSITGFAQRYEKYYNAMIVSQLSVGTIRGYSSKIALICIEYGKLPEELTKDEITSYLAMLMQRTPTPAESFFIHTVSGLRSYYRIMGLPDRVVDLPGIKRRTKLPVIFSKEEIKRLLQSLGNIKEKAIIAMLYSSGLRVSELCNLEISDIDSDRMTIHVRQSKGRKDRYVPLSYLALKALRLYFKEYRPTKYLFNGSGLGSRMNDCTFRDILQKACVLAGCKKRATCHTLRHSYATHLLEMGENIFTIRDLLGHRYLKSTFIYLHIAQVESKKPFSPLDRLFDLKP